MCVFVCYAVVESSVCRDSLVANVCLVSTYIRVCVCVCVCVEEKFLATPSSGSSPLVFRFLASSGL